MRQLVGRKRASATLGVLLALVVVGGVFAYWTQSGSGSGTAQAGTTVPVTVNQTSPITGLYPGGPAQTLSGNFDNPNPGASQGGCRERRGRPGLDVRRLLRGRLRDRRLRHRERRDPGQVAPLAHGPA